MTRPAMHARDSSGRNVSLLNDEPPQHHTSPSSRTYTSYRAHDMNRPASDYTTPSIGGSPTIPALVRADSFDSELTNDTHSPITPHSDLARKNSFMSAAPAYKDQNHFDYQERMHPYPELTSSQYRVPVRSPYEDSALYSHPQVYDAESYHTGSVPERGTKRFSCRYRDSMECDKTFTTSGHASRHSKIHTAEKAVPCTFEGCHKKFTRNDNMKQHLETHYKDRTRSSNLSKSGAKTPPLTLQSGIRKRTPSRPQTPARTASMMSDAGRSSVIDPALFASQPYTQLSRPMSDNLSPTSTASGLDALAAAIDLQNYSDR